MSCSLSVCDAGNPLGGFGSVYVWLSHVMIGISAVSYTLAFGLVIDGASNIAQLHALDPILKEKGIKSKEAAYVALAACEDQAVKHMAFWLVSLQRTWGVFQTTMGMGCWVIIFVVPVKYRASVHFLLAYLQVVVGFIAASLAWGCPIPDLVVKFGGAKPGAVAPDGKGMPRPKNSGVTGDFYTHLVFGVINVALGACALVLELA